MSPLSSLFYSTVILLLSSVLLHRCSHANRGDVEGRHIITVQSLSPNDACSSPKGFNHTGLKVVYSHGPCSPLARWRKLQHQQILNRDQSRVDSLHRRKDSTASKRDKTKSQGSLVASEIPARRGSSVDTANYIVTVGLGTPKKDFTVVFDTGSDVTWIQCQPCASYCYPQQEPLFDSSQSSTYSNISCDSADCSQLDRSGCSGSTCVYAVQYGDNSYTVGFFAKDTLTLTPSDVLPDFRFGCGEQNRGLFGRAAGLLGLGRDPVSVVSQSSQKYGGVFSYCLPPTSSSTGYLTFGSSSSSSNVRFTPMLTDANHPSFYSLNLLSISVGGQQLSIPPTVFSTAGTIIDSGTVITRLPPSAYSALRSAFRQGMSNYPTAPPLSILDTCYNFTGYDTVSVPKVALGFGGGATMDLEIPGTLYVANISQACLAFAGNSNAGDLGIIGNVQQRTFSVVYDIPQKVIGFGPGGCS